MFSTPLKEKLANPRILSAERKLDTAIRSSIVDSFLQRIKEGKCTYDDTVLMTSQPDLDKADKTTDSTASILLNILSSEASSSYKPRVDFHRVFKYAERNITLQHYFVHHNNKLPNKDQMNQKLHTYLKKLAPDHVLLDVCHWVDLLMQVVEAFACFKSWPDKKLLETSSALIDSERQQFHHQGLKFHLYWNSKIVVLHHGSRKWLLPRESILQLHNKLCDLMSVLVLCKMESGVSLEKEAYAITTEFIKEVCSLLCHYQDRYYPIGKSIESLCIGEILCRSDEWENDDLILVLDKELKSESSFKYIGSLLRKIIIKSSTPLIAELSCLSKIAGHPHIDIDLGMHKVHKKANTPLPIKVEAVGFSICCITEDFVKAYWSRYKKWPTVSLSTTLVHPGILYAWSHDVNPFTREIEQKHGRILTEDWVHVELQQCLEFQYLENMIPFLQDKAISALQSEVVNKYLNNKKIHVSKKRLLLHYLLNDGNEIDHIQFLDDYVKSGHDMREVVDYLVIRLCPKEKEEKPEGRFFGCMTYLNRCRMLIQEKNMMNYLDLFSQDQAMTLSEFALTKKLYAFRSFHEEYVHCKVFQMNFDASSWCSGWREASTAPPLSKTVDALFGIPLFSKTHRMYRNTLFYNEDILHEFFWRGQLGGIEGLSQDTWVMLYIAQIKYAFRDTGYKIHVLCKGDDLRVMVVVPETEIVTSIKDFILELKTHVCTKIGHFGHNMKIQESYGSECFFTFSKQFSIFHIELTSQFRKIQKCYGSNNAVLPTLFEYIGSSYSNAHSSCYVGVTHYSSYLVALVWSYYYLQVSKDPTFNDITDDEMVSLLLIPSCAGGFPIIYLHNMFVRAESDLLSSFCDLALYTRDFWPEFWKCLSRVLLQPMVLENDRHLLALDPYGLPLTQPISAKSYMRSQIRRILSRITVNHVVRELLDSFNNDSKSEFLKVLTSSTTEILSRVVAAVYSSSPHQIIDELVSSFDNGKSITNFLMAHTRRPAALRALKNAIKKDHLTMSWRKDLIRGKLQSGRLIHLKTESEKCPMFLAQEWRRKAYGISVVTVNNPPLSHFVSFIYPYDPKVSEHDRKNHFRYVEVPTKESLKRTKTTDHFTFGTAKPFLGHKTTTGTLEPEVHMVEKDPIVSKEKSSLMLLDWTTCTSHETSSNMPQLLEEMIKVYTDTPLIELRPYTSARLRGTASHHIRGAEFKESIVPNVRSNMYSRVRGETNSHVTFQERRGGHLNVNFLQIYCHAVTILFSELQISSSTNNVKEMWAVTNNCPHCNEFIIEEPIVLKKKYNPKFLFPKIKALKVGKTAEKLLKEALVQFREEQDKMRPADDLADIYPINVCERALVYGLVTSTFHHVKHMFEVNRMHAATPDSLDIFHSISSEESKKIVSLTDIKRISFVNILDGLKPFVIEYCLRNMHRLNQETLEICFIIHPPYSMPWVMTLIILQRAGLLSKFLQFVSSYYKIPPPLCYGNPETSSRYLGRCIMREFLEDPHYDMKIYHLSLSNMEPLSTRITSYQYIYRKALFTRFWRETFTLTKIKEMDVEIIREDPNFEEWRDAIFRCIMCVLSPISEEAMELTLADGEDHTLHILDHDKTSLEDLEKFFDVEWTFYEWMYSWIDKNKHCPIEAILSTLDSDDWQDGLDMFENSGAYDFPLTVGCYNFITCTSTIRGKAKEETGNEVKDLPTEAGTLHRLAPPRENSVVFRQHPTRLIPKGVPTEVNPFIPIETNSRGTYYTRWLGGGVSSCSKLIEILRSYNIDISSLTGVAYTLGEGYGGVSQFLMDNSNLTVVFNSINREKEDLVRPEIALNNLEDLDRIRFHHTKHNLNDLSKYITLKDIISHYPGKGSIVWCDADIDILDTESSLIWFNVARFFLEHRIPSGVLILKIFINYTNAIGSIVTFLKYYCTTVSIFRCTTSHLGYESYLVAQGVARPFIPQDDSIMNVSLPSVVLQCHQLYRDRVNTINQFKNMHHLLTTEERRSHIRDVSNYMVRYDSLINPLTIRFGITYQSICAVTNDTKPHQYSQVIGMKKYVSIVMKSIGTTSLESRNIIGDITTLAHMYRQIELLIRLVSLWYQLQKGTVSSPGSRRQFSAFWNKHIKVPDRTKVVVHIDITGNLIFSHVPECPLDAAGSYREGIEMFYRLIGYFDHKSFLHSKQKPTRRSSSDDDSGSYLSDSITYLHQDYDF